MGKYFQAIMDIPKIDKALEQAIESCLDQISSQLKKDFTEKYLSGNIKLQDLKKLDHPFARRHHPEFNSVNLLPASVIVKNQMYFYKGKTVPLDEINIQSGKLLNSVKEFKKKSFDKYEAGINIDTNSVNYAKYVFFGTRLMIPRPLHLTFLISEKEFVVDDIRRNVIKKFREQLGKNRLKVDVRTYTWVK